MKPPTPKKQTGSHSMDHSKNHKNTDLLSWEDPTLGKVVSTPNRKKSGTGAGELNLLGSPLDSKATATTSGTAAGANAFNFLNQPLSGGVQ